jgi:hypothetical protein
MSTDLPIIQKTYDLIKWYVPILHRLPRDYRFTLGDRMITGLYRSRLGKAQWNPIPEQVLLGSASAPLNLRHIRVG